MQPFTLLLPFLGLAAAAAHRGGAPFCHHALGHLGSAQQSAAAWQYCSSYHPGGAKTATKTSTVYTGTTTATAVVTKTTSTTTVTSISTRVKTVTSNVLTCVVPTTTYGASTTTTTAAVTKRNAGSNQPEGWSHYSGDELTSACDCLGSHSTHTVTKTITAEYTSISTTDVVGTKTKTDITTSVTTVYTASIPTFSLYVLGEAPAGSRADNNGNYFGLDGNQAGSTYTQIVVDEGEDGATLFSLNADTALRVDSDPTTGTTFVGALAIEDSSFPNGAPDYVYAQTPAGITADQGDGTQVTITCSISANSDNTCPLACTTSTGDTTFNYCAVGLRLGTAQGSCDPYQHIFTPYVISPTV